MTKTKIEQTKKTYRDKVLKGAPIHFVTDFNNGLSPAECSQVILNIFDDKGISNGERSKIIGLHDVNSLDIRDGAFNIYQLADNRRRRPSIFVGIVDPGVGGKRRGLVVRTEENHVFIGPDNGLFGPALSRQVIRDAYCIDQEFFEKVTPTFHGRDIFSPIAAEIASGVDPDNISYLQSIDPSELIGKGYQAGEVVHLDGYNNIKFGQKGVPVNENGIQARAVTIKTQKHSIEAFIVRTLEDVEIGEWLAYEGSSGKNGGDGHGHIETAIRDRVGEDGAAKKLGVVVGDIVELEWKFFKE